MDKIDKKILSALQRDGRLSITELAEQVGLSLSPCHRRVKLLEDIGVIKGYRAELDMHHLGLGFSAIVFVTMKSGEHQAIQQFEAALSDIANVISAQRLFGEPDYMLHIVADSLAGFQKLYDEKLSSIPNILRLSSTIVMKHLLQERGLPVF